MKTVIGFIVLLVVLTACNKVDSESNSLQGRYIGIFNRTGMDTAQVNLIFNANRFEGESNKQTYPAICRGSYDINYNSIHFTDSCAWTANFDWSLILSGDYNISFNEGTVRIWKTTGNITDEYLLRQPTR
ncbi:MAG TPA: hypothetical protein VF487_14620 [Chitinophagaceae bacterium]